jgi:hypothetical protein
LAERERITRSSRPRVHRHIPLNCARALRAFVDERRIVAGNQDQKSIPGKRWFSNSI